MKKLVAGIMVAAGGLGFAMSCAPTDPSGTGHQALVITCDPTEAPEEHADAYCWYTGCNGGGPDERDNCPITATDTRFMTLDGGNVGRVSLHYSEDCCAVWAETWSDYLADNGLYTPLRSAAYVSYPGWDVPAPETDETTKMPRLEQNPVFSATTAADTGVYACGWIEVNLRNNGGLGVFSVCSDGQDHNLPPDCSQAQVIPNDRGPGDLAWEGHQLVRLKVGPVSDPDGDDVELSITQILQSQPTQGTGQGAGGYEHCPDADLPSGTSGFRSQPADWASEALVSTERNGPDAYGDGRVYYIRMTARDSKGATCEKVLEVCMRKDDGSPCQPSGARFNSTQCPCERGVCSG